MKELNLPDVFAEILSGLFVLVGFAPVLDLADVVSSDQMFTFVLAHVTISQIAALLIICYMLGLVMGAIGLAVGELFLERLVNANAPTQAQREHFWSNVPEHVLKYRELQWSFYRAYRNVFLLLPVGVILWVSVTFRRGHIYVAAVIAVMGVFLSFALWRSMKTLLAIYFRLATYEYQPSSSRAA